MIRVALNIWRLDPRERQRRLQPYEPDTPEEATLLDCLDINTDRHELQKLVR